MKLARSMNVRFAYSSDYIPVNDRMDAAADEITLKKALDQLFEDRSIKYRMIGDQIVLKMVKRREIGLLDPVDLNSEGNIKPFPIKKDEKEPIEKLAVIQPVQFERQRQEFEALQSPDLKQLPGGDRIVQLDLNKYRALTEITTQKFD